MMPMQGDNDAVANSGFDIDIVMMLLLMIQYADAHTDFGLCRYSVCSST